MSGAAPTRPRLANIDRLHRLMERDDLAAVVARSGINVTYLAEFGYPGTLARHLEMASSVRGVAVVWPRSGEPIVIVDPAAEPVTRLRASIERLEVYVPYVETVYSRLADVLRRMGLGRERVGFEKDAVSALHWEDLERALPGLAMVDCAAMLDEVRLIKTPAEVLRFTQAADLLDEAYLEVFPTIRASETEREVHSRMLAACIRRGAGWAHGILNSSTNEAIYCGEGDTAFQRGDLVRTDYVAYVEGYPGHQSRMAVLGRPSAAQRRDYAITRDVHRSAIAGCRPGALASDLYREVVRAFAAHGIRYTASLVGHGVGTWFHQQEPILTQSRDVPLQEGMVLAIEPYRGSWHIQDLVLVTAAEPRLLSARFSTDELFVID